MHRIVVVHKGNGAEAGAGGKEGHEVDEGVDEERANRTI